jgi:hypothetical protein
MPTVYFDRNYTKRVSQFCEEKSDKTQRPIFSTNLEFMIFTALIGRYFNDSDATQNISIDKSNKEIPDRIFKNSDKDGIAYLLALDSEKNGEILRGEDDNKLWKYIENYAFLGCQEIEKWLTNPNRVNIDREDIILEQMKKISQEVLAGEIDLDKEEDIEFMI